MVKILCIALLIVVFSIGDKNIFLLLDVIKFSLRGILPITILMCFLCSSSKSEDLWSTKTIVIIDIIQIVIWYAIEKKWDRDKCKQFYLTYSNRKNVNGMIISIPIILYAYFISQVTFKIVEVVKAII